MAICQSVHLQLCIFPFAGMAPHGGKQPRELEVSGQCRDTDRLTDSLWSLGGNRHRPICDWPPSTDAAWQNKALTASHLDGSGFGCEVAPLLRVVECVWGESLARGRPPPAAGCRGQESEVSQARRSAPWATVARRPTTVLTRTLQLPPR